MKKMKITIKQLSRIIIVLSLAFAVSCENALKEDIYSFIAKDNFYQNQDDAEAAMIGIYSGLCSNDVYGRWYFDLIHLTDDQVTIHRNPLFYQMDDFNYTTDHPYIQSLWSGTYTVIKYANVAIARIPTIDIDEELKNSYLAEARMIRACMYFNLVRLWGAVPLTIDEVGDEASANIPKGSIDEIYEVIINDLKYAEVNLPLIRNEDEFGRVTKGAAKALYADVLLTREDWSGAATKAKEVIDLGIYSLQSNFENIFEESNESNSEIIFSIVFDGVNRGNWMASFSHNGGTDNANCYNGAHVWEVDAKSDMWLNWDTNDPRRTFTVSDKYLSKDGTYKNLLSTSSPYPEFGKWNSPNENGTANCPLNPIIYRYADVLLMYAEAEALSQAPNQAAYDAINKVRRRAYKQPLDSPSAYDLQSGLNTTDFRNAVIKERSCEFVVEGKRLFDLMRTGQFPQILIQMGKQVTPGARYFPIPSSEIDANSSLTSEDQNTGY